MLAPKTPTPPGIDMRSPILAAITVAVLANSVARGAERETICAHYETANGWSDGYKVDAIVASGLELNQANSSFDYNGFSEYVTIFWSQDQATVIELDDPYLTAFDSDGKDQQGRKWRVAKSSLCI